MTRSSNEMLPIPENNIQGWRNVKITECGEELISLKRYPIDRVNVKPEYYLRGIPGAVADCCIRESVYGLLRMATFILPKRYSFLVWDAWRSFQVQQRLFRCFVEKLEMQYPSCNEEELIQKSQRYVSLPSDSPNEPSPHCTGGAIDLTLLEENGPVEMGSDFDDFSVISHTRHFEQKKEEVGIENIEESYINNRRILYFTMIEAGFTNYPFEWWHYDYGNQFWGKITESFAIYGYCPDIFFRRST